MISRVYGNAGVPIQLKGNAYDFGHAITALQFSLDNGVNWTSYITEDTNDYQNLTWDFEFTLENPGNYVMLVRSVNDAGEPSPEPASVEIRID